MINNYHLGLLCLAQLLVSADGTVDQAELDALDIIRQREGISPETFTAFEDLIRDKKEKEVFQLGIGAINECPLPEKIKVFVTLYKLSEVDGRVHVKEIRLLLYSLKLTKIDFEDVVAEAMKTPSFNDPLDS